MSDLPTDQARAPNDVFDRIYARVGWRAAHVMVLSQIAVTLVLIAMAAALVVLGYLDGDARQYWTFTALGMSTGLAAILAGVGVRWRSLVPALRWLRDPQCGVSPQAAWTAAALAPLRFVASIAVIGIVVTPSTSAWYLIGEFDLTAWGSGGVIIAAATAVVGAGLLTLALAEQILRPAVKEIATALPAGWQPPRSAWNVRAKVAASLFGVAAVSAIASGAFVPHGASPGVRFATTVVSAIVFVTLVVGPAVALGAEVILGPLRSLRDAAERVGHGDFSTLIAATTPDEFGRVIASFNLLQDRVREQIEELRASRARIVTASDAERRRVERNLHDGAQQRLVALALQLRMLEEAADSDPHLRGLASGAAEQLKGALAQLRELARGLHPQVLTTGGLAPALRQLAERSSVPVTVNADSHRCPESVESAAYFVASEALANVAKYSRAATAQVSAEHRNGRLMLVITDDGIGGADPQAGSGLTGLADRVAALDGTLTVRSPVGHGTEVTAELPLSRAAGE